MPALGIGEGAVIALSAVLSLLPLLGWIGLVIWARRVGARYPESSPWRRLWLLPVASLAAQTLGLGGTVLVLVVSFSGTVLSGIPAEDRVTVLARNISDAMSLTALGLVLSVVLLVASMVAVIVGHVRAPRA